MTPAIVRLVAYSIVFLLIMVIINLDDPNPGTFEPTVVASFWSAYHVELAMGLLIAIAGYFEKLLLEPKKPGLIFRLAFITGSVLFLLTGLITGINYGYFLLDYWYSYFLIALWSGMVISLYYELLTDKKKNFRK